MLDSGSSVSEAPAWVDHTTKTVVTYGPAIGALYAAGHVLWLGSKKLFRRRARGQERQAALENAVRMLLDLQRETLHPPEREDDRDAFARLGARKEQVDDARDRLWLALGKKRSAPSRAPSDETSEDS